MNEIKGRGTQDILIAVVDGLKGFPEAITAVFPDTVVQTCIVHLIRYSMQFASWKERKLVAAALKPVYPVDAAHPLFVYLPCGVGGAPGGITFGLRHLLGDHVHCFFAEPVASPCMLVRLAALHDAPISVRDAGLDGRTEADGLAVNRASELSASMMKPLVSGVFTGQDDHFFADAYRLAQSAGVHIEPSAAAGFRGPGWILNSEPGRDYLARHRLEHCMASATHILWTTGGALVPPEEQRRFEERGRAVATGDHR